MKRRFVSITRWNDEPAFFFTPVLTHSPPPLSTIFSLIYSLLFQQVCYLHSLVSIYESGWGSRRELFSIASCVMTWLSGTCLELARSIGVLYDTTVSSTIMFNNLGCSDPENLPDLALPRSHLIYGSFLTHFFSWTLVR